MNPEMDDTIIDAEIVPQRAAEHVHDWIDVAPPDELVMEQWVCAGCGATPKETVPNLPAVKEPAGLPAVPEDRTEEQVFALAAAWTAPTEFPRYWWANSLPKAIQSRKARTFKSLILMALEDGFDGEEPVSRDEFEVALLEVDAKLGAA
jgi:hypothetical protein